MRLEEIYRPIEKELNQVEQVLRNSLKSSRYKPILEISNYLLEAGGKNLRPTLVLLSAKATLSSLPNKDALLKIAAAVELIHRASLIHDDVIDHADLRHNKPTINAKWGQDTSIALGDYLYSVAFELVSDCGNPDIIRCISSAVKSMCEGELLQVCERDDLNLLKERYVVIVKKKTASLFAVSCRVGTMISNTPRLLQDTLKDYGLNFGIAFQIIDDYLDFVGKKQTLGKLPGQDVACGEFTLPILNVWASVSKEQRLKLKMLLTSRQNKAALKMIKTKLFSSGAANKTKETALSFLNLAKEKLNTIPVSSYKQSLLDLADFIIERGFNNEARRVQEF